MLKSVLIANRAQITLSLAERVAATLSAEARRRKRRGEGRATAPAPDRLNAPLVVLEESERSFLKVD
jgi:hypothetical protein